MKATVSLVSKQYEAIHKVNQDSLKEHLPEFEHLTLALDDYKHMTNDYLVGAVEHLCLALRPKIVLELFAKGYKQVMYLGSDVVFFNKPKELLQSTATTVVPHIIEPLPFDGGSPAVNDVHRTGHINSDCVLWVNDSPTTKFLQWQDAVHHEHCRAEVKQGIFFDQGWLNCLPFFSNRVRILRHSGYNVAYFNLATRDLKKEGDSWVVKEAGRETQLVFFQFTGFDFSNPAKISVHNGRHQATGDALELMNWYKAEVERNATKV